MNERSFLLHSYVERPLYRLTVVTNRDMRSSNFTPSTYRTETHAQTPNKHGKKYTSAMHCPNACMAKDNNETHPFMPIFNIITDPRPCHSIVIASQSQANSVVYANHQSCVMNSLLLPLSSSTYLSAMPTLKPQKGRVKASNRQFRSETKSTSVESQHQH